MTTLDRAFVGFAVMADVDGDGKIDVISSTEGDIRRLLVHFAPTTGDYANVTHWTTREFPATLAGERRWMYAVPLDVNEDGHLDIVAAGKGRGAKIAWFEAPRTDKRDLAAWKFHPMDDAGWIMSVIAHDMDGDGDQDILVSDRKGDDARQGVRWLENPGPGSAQRGPWKSFAVGSLPGEIMFIRQQDVDGDGLLDVLVPSKPPNSLIWLRRLDDTGRHWQDHEIPYPEHTGRAKSVAAGDLNSDGKIDIILAHEHANPPLSGIVWLEGPSWIRRELSGPEGIKFDRIELHDFDGDGDLDVLTTEENFGDKSIGLGVVWYENPNNRRNP